MDAEGRAVITEHRFLPQESQDCYCRIMTRADYRRQGSVDAIDNNQSDIGTVQNDVKPSADIHATTQDRPKERRRCKQGVVQRTAPTASKQILECQWSVDFIINEQCNDPVLSVVREWLLRGQRPPLSQLKANPDLRTY